MRLALVVGSIFVTSIPLAVSMWAFLDAARRPEWAFALANRNRTAWVTATLVGTLFCLVGVVVSVWYLVKVRPVVAAAETGRIT